MRHLVVILCVALVAVAAAPADPVELLRYNNDPYDNGLGKYDFSYVQSDGSIYQQRAEVRNQGLENEFLAVTGVYSWVAPNGIRYIVKYRADDNGYNADQEEQPPGAPLEVANALLG